MGGAFSCVQSQGRLAIARLIIIINCVTIIIIGQKNLDCYVTLALTVYRLLGGSRAPNEPS